MALPKDKEKPHWNELEVSEPYPLRALFNRDVKNKNGGRNGLRARLARPSALNQLIIHCGQTPMKFNSVAEQGRKIAD
jgi:hypothetical protein